VGSGAIITIAFLANSWLGSLKGFQVIFNFVCFVSLLGLPTRTLFLTKLVTKVKPNINSVEVHPQLSE
jgi:hypothetical protein